MNQFIEYINDDDHYSSILLKTKLVKNNLWIGTADIKDLYVKDGLHTLPFLGLLSNIISRKVEVRLLHAKEPGPQYRKDFDKFPILTRSLERAVCPRVHFKMIIFDLHSVYIGSANLTGAGLGMKSVNRRNFEAGIYTNHPDIVERAINQFDTVWQGAWCKKCERREFCGDRLDG